MSCLMRTDCRIRRNAKVPVSIANGIRKPLSPTRISGGVKVLAAITSACDLNDKQWNGRVVLPVVGLSKPSGKQAVGGGPFHHRDWSEPSEFGVWVLYIFRD